MTMAKLKVKKGDTVVVITGKDSSKKGKIIEALPGEGKVVVEGVNVVKRHTKPSQALPQGGIVQKPAPIDASNVMVVCPKCGKATRVAKKENAKGQMVRACKKCNKELE